MSSATVKLTFHPSIAIHMLSRRPWGNLCRSTQGTPSPLSRSSSESLRIAWNMKLEISRRRRKKWPSSKLSRNLRKPLKRAASSSYPKRSDHFFIFLQLFIRICLKMRFAISYCFLPSCIEVVFHKAHLIFFFIASYTKSCKFIFFCCKKSKCCANIKVKVLEEGSLLNRSIYAPAPKFPWFYLPDNQSNCPKIYLQKLSLK